MLNDFEVKFPPCKCEHERREHVHSDRSVFGHSELGFCDHDRGAIFRGMCNCYMYERMDNLEYLEYLDEQKSQS